MTHPPTQTHSTHNAQRTTAWTLLWRHALSKNPLIRELAGLDSPQASPARPHKNKARKDH